MRGAPKLLLVRLALVLSLIAGTFITGVCAQERSIDPGELTANALTLLRQGKYADALSLAHRALEIREKNPGPEHPDTARTLNTLGQIYDRIGNYSKAEELFLRSLKIKETKLGLNDPSTATSLGTLAALYKNMGYYTKAEALYKRVLNIRQKTLGPEDRDIATSLNNLGALYYEIGDYAKAEPCFRSARDIYEKSLGPDDPDTSASLNNLAALYVNMGDYTKAEPIFGQALAIKEKQLGRDHPDTATSLDNLAALYTKKADYAQAEPLYQQALKIRENKLGPGHAETATSFNNLGATYRMMGDYTKAESCLQQALRINEKASGLEHPSTAVGLINLGTLYHQMGDFAKAEDTLQRSLSILENVLGPGHPNIAKALRELSELQFDLGRLDTACSLASKHKVASEKNLGLILAFASERQRMAYQQDKRSNDLLATFGSAADLAEAVLRNKGIVLDSLLEDELVAGASEDPEIKNAVGQLRVAVRRLTQLQMEIPKDFSSEAQKRRQTERETLEQQVEDMQKTLARNVAAIGQTRRALRTKVSDVQAVLPRNTVLMEFVRYTHYLGQLKCEQRYGAVLVGKEEAAFTNAKPGEPVWVPLGSAKAIEKNLREYGEMMRGNQRGEVNLLRTLYTQLFEPIQKRLPKDITTLVISPDAELNFVSFATFVDDQNKFLAEKFTLNYVASGRDLVLKRTAKTGSRQFAAFANPAFGEKPLMAGAHDTTAVQLAMLSSDQRDYAGVSLGALPNTMQEAQFLRDRSSSWNMEGAVHAGAQASEAEVKAVKSPYILHLATHGFFLPDTLPTIHLATVLRNPMQRSGLAFAGAQLTLGAWKRGETPDTENDGILMAQEVGTMDLKETWLVVLSACDTGIGEARAGEGVLGLRRGFIQAGAQNLLMTLWPVSDKYTVELMKAFYERALKDSNAPRALAEVQRDFLVKIKNEKNAVLAARLAGPFVMTFQGKN